jgi:hypothetical protein
MEEQIADEGRELGPFRGLYQAARRLGSAGGQSLVSGLFPEAQDPALREAQAIESIKMKYQGQDFTNPSVLRSMASELGSVAPNAAIRLAQLSKELSAKESNVFGKIDPKDYTPDSLRQFAQTGDYTKLVAVKKESEGTEFERLISDLSPQEQKRYKEQYLKNKITPSMSPALVPVIMKEESALSNLKFGATDVSNAISNLKSGTLKLGLKENFANSLKTLAGKSDEGSKAFSQFNVALETLRNARLNLNVGVQTEGDAVRAANEFLANYDRYDTQTALTQLERVYAKLETAYNSKQGSLRTTIGASGTSLPDSFFSPFPSIKTGKPGLSDEELKAKFEAASAKYPKWKQLGFEAYKKQVTGK